MIPIIDAEEQQKFYQGYARFTGQIRNEYGEILYFFDNITDSISLGYWAEEDIKKEM